MSNLDFKKISFASILLQPLFDHFFFVLLNFEFLFKNSCYLNNLTILAMFQVLYIYMSFKTCL